MSRLTLSGCRSGHEWTAKLSSDVWSQPKPMIFGLQGTSSNRPTV
jgi:hypothetical protein